MNEAVKERQRIKLKFKFKFRKRNEIPQNAIQRFPMLEKSLERINWQSLNLSRRYSYIQNIGFREQKHDWACFIEVDLTGNSFSTYGMPISKMLFWMSCFPNMMMLSWIHNSIRQPPGAHWKRKKGNETENEQQSLSSKIINNICSINDSYSSDSSLTGIHHYATTYNLNLPLPCDTGWKHKHSLQAGLQTYW